MTTVTKLTLFIFLFFISSLVISYGLNKWKGYGAHFWKPIENKLVGKKTTEQVITKLKPKISKRWQKIFDQFHFSDWPQKIAFHAFKQERRFEVWAMNKAGEWYKIKTYKIRAASGRIGPKLKEGDYQVPEGQYKITFLNPNSLYHLSMRLNYPNAKDIAQAKKEGRSNLGGDIMIHGRAVSAGCIALGDAAIEELFFLTHKVGMRNVEVIILPYDMQKHTAKVVELEQSKVLPEWVIERYNRLSKKLETFTN